MCLGVATFAATRLLTVVLFIALLHSLAWALLHERIVFEVSCSSGSDGGESNSFPSMLERIF